jgi:hypothetical protein
LQEVRQEFDTYKFQPCVLIILFNVKNFIGSDFGIKVLDFVSPIIF